MHLQNKSQRTAICTIVIQSYLQELQDERKKFWIKPISSSQKQSKFNQKTVILIQNLVIKCVLQTTSMMRLLNIN